MMVSFRAEKRGRFIPCRAGGTATTYYTDPHDVDEDLTAIVNCGGAWAHATAAGITRRCMDNPSDPSHQQGVVASRLIYLS